MFQRDFPLQEGLQRCQDEGDLTVDDDAITRATERLKKDRGYLGVLFLQRPNFSIRPAQARRKLTTDIKQQLAAQLRMEGC